MATFFKYNIFPENLAEKVYNLQTDTIKVALTNTAPAAADTVWSVGVYPAPAAANGYTAGGNTLTVSSSSQTAGLYKLILTTPSTFTATAGGIGPFRYAIIYDSTAANGLIGAYDYGASITMVNGETLNINFDPSNGLLTIQ